MPSPEDKQNPRGIGGLPHHWHTARHPPSNPQASFKGKTVLITGANAGLGRETTLKFAHLSASHIILGVRSIAKGEETKAAILAQQPNPPRVTVLEIDYSAFASVATFVNAVRNATSTLDIAILNAGVAMPSYRRSLEGWEMTLQVNVLSTGLLAKELLPLLRASSPVREKGILEVVASVAFADVRPEWCKHPLLDYWNRESNFDMNKQYHISKLATMFVVESLAAENARPEDPIILASCPGLCRTSLGREFSWGMRAVNWVFQGVFARTAEEGARTIVSATTLGGEAHGRLWVDDCLDGVRAWIREEEWGVLKGKCWEEVKEVLGGIRRCEG